MKIFKTGFVFFLFSLFCNMQTYAQLNLLDINDLSNTNIDSYSNAELKAYYDKTVELNISEAQAYKLLKEKGLPDAEVTKLRNRLNVINSGAKNEVKTPTDITKDEPVVQNSRSYDGTAYEEKMQEVNKDLSIFGSELFLKNSLVFEPNLRIPTPASYILGPDDEIVVSVYGVSEKKYTLQVNEEGEIYIQNVGPVYVNGLSIEQATQKIKSKLASTIYRAINTGQTKVQVSLGKIRSIRVTVIGQAIKPGTFTVSSLTTLYNLLYLCGGPNNLGSFREIEVIRGNEVRRVADLYAFLVKGNQKDNILLQEGDVIRIPYYKNRVEISGNIRREGKYEMLDNETFENLIQFCGGFNEVAYKAAVSVIRITDKEKIIIDLPAVEYKVFKSSGGDQYFVNKLQDNFSNKISISGSVIRPGNYELKAGTTTLKTLIEKAGGLTVDAYTERVSVFRYSKNKLPSVFSINLDSVLQFNTDVYLNKDDSVSVHSIFDFKDNQYVNVGGNVRNPGLIQWRDHLSLKDVLLATGGINDFGDSSTIEISRRLKNANIDLANHTEIETILVSLVGDKDISKDVQLQPFDIIMIKTLPGIVTQRTVLMLGEIRIPGRYSLQKSGDKITDIMKRVGGFRASADSSSITIRRSIKSNLSIQEREALFQRILKIDSDSIAENQKLRNEVYKNTDLISVNLAKALANPEGLENLVLEDGDILSIDKNTNLVRITGEVYYPTLVPLNSKKSLKYYVEQAGSFMPSARKSASFVIYPDGKVKTVNSFLGIKSYPDITSRSEIFVPQKNNKNGEKLGIGEWALIVSTLALVSSVIVTAIK